ncbi:MAG: MBL fold metallo-hydrolase [Deltaproteobacteria bacterium]|nr:MBL fold metallo-hydrolase [Deltaproteobacteria bacterium]
MQGSVRILVDNLAGGGGLRHGWGFACLLESDEGKVLFDTGPEGEMLLNNMEVLGIDPAEIHHVVLSHAHWDHIGGLPALLRMRRKPELAIKRFRTPGLSGDDLPRIEVWVPKGFSDEVCEKIQSQGGECRVMDEPGEILPGMWSTGPMDGGLVEHGLLQSCQDGPLLITGCAHPGVVEMVEKAGALGMGPVRWVLGGFHLMADSREDLARVAQELKDLGVRRVGPGHCTGITAQKFFAEAFLEDCDSIQCGSSFVFNPKASGGPRGQEENGKESSQEGEQKSKQEDSEEIQQEGDQENQQEGDQENRQEGRQEGD